MNIPKETIDNLMIWFSTHGRVLPWRGESDPYKIWVSEVMLQQTQVASVIEYYTRWIKKYPTLRHLADSDLNDVLQIWEGLGYYARARNLYKGVQFILETWNGSFPQNVSDLLKIPGIGPYTAGAIMSLAFNKPVAAIDGNVIRVLSRLLTYPFLKSDNSSVKKLSGLIEASFFDYDPRWVNQAWMELGALICQPRPRCKDCCINSYCRAYQSKRIHQFPVKKQKHVIPFRKGAVFIIRRENRILMLRRPENGLLGGLWEPPSILFHIENKSDFIIRTGINIQHRYQQTARHQYSHFKVEYSVFEATLDQDQVWPLKHWVSYCWCQTDDLIKLPKPKVHIKALHIADIL